MDAGCRSKQLPKAPASVVNYERVLKAIRGRVCNSLVIIADHGKPQSIPMGKEACEIIDKGLARIVGVYRPTVPDIFLHDDFIFFGLLV